MDVVIERAQPEDADAMIAFMNIIGAETDNLTYGSEGFPVSQEEEAEIIREKNESPRNALFAAKKDGRIIGDASVEAFSRRSPSSRIWTRCSQSRMGAGNRRQIAGEWRR